jgi:hypothetical protein
MERQLSNVKTQQSGGAAPAPQQQGQSVAQTQQSAGAPAPAKPQIRDWASI